MESHILEGLTLRLEAAERGLSSARRAMWMGSLLVVAATGGAVWWVSRAPVVETPETVEAQHFIVRDAQGAARAVLQQSAGGSTQLVFFRDPLIGDEWRQHTSTGPFSFGVRALDGGSQMVFNDREGGTLQFAPTGLALTRGGVLRLSFEPGESEPRIGLVDSTGKTQALTPSLLASVAKPAAKAGTQPKRRRR